MKRLTFATFAVLLATLTAIAAPDNPKPQAPPMPAIRAMAPVSHLAQEEPINFGASLLYDPLYIWEPGEKGPQLRPCLAADWPEYSEDGLTCTIRLRPGAKLHYNGGSRRPRRVIEIVASDIVFTLKYGAKLRNHNGYSILEGVIDGLDAIPAGRKATDWGALDEEFEVAGLNVVDNNTLEIRLTRPTRLLPVMLAHPMFCVITSSFLESEHHALGYRSGPLTHGKEFDTRRWELEWVDPAPEGASALTIHTSMTSTSELAREIEEHSLDAVYLIEPGQRERWPADLALRPLPLELMFYLGFNMRDPVWGALDDDGRALRAAVSRAFDRECLARSFPEPLDHSYLMYEASPMRDMMPSRQGMKPTGTPGEWSQGETTGVFDVKLRIAFCGGDSKGDTFAQLAKALATIGVEAVFEGYAESEFVESIREGKADAWIMGWMNDSPDPAIFLSKLRSGDPAKMSDTGLFAGGYISKEYDTALAELEAIDPREMYSKKRERALRKAVEILERDRPYVPLVESIFYEWYADGIKAPELPLSTGTRLRHLRR